MDAGHYTTRFENAHRTILRELLYRYHPWFGRHVCVHEAIEKADGVVFRCTLSGSEADRGLEIPAWMFDRTVCPDQPPLMEAPFVSMGALAALSTLLDLALKDGVASSNVPLSSASRTSRDQNRGEAHVRQNNYVSEQAAARSAAEAAADGSVQGRHGRQRRRRPRMARATAEAQSMLTSLIAQLILDHAGKTEAAPTREAGDDL